MSRRSLYSGNKEKYCEDIINAVKCGNINKAAKNLGMSESSLRKHIILLGISDKVKESIDNSKATVSQSVITMAKEGASDVSIADNLGINKSRVKRIRIENGLLRKRGKSGRIRKENIRAMMMSELREKYTFSDIAEAFGCSKQNVQQIVSSWEVYRRDQG